MSYFPVLNAPELQGVTTVFNFAPNNWEEGPKTARHLNASFSDGKRWINRCLGEVRYGNSVTVSAASSRGLLQEAPNEATLFLTLSDKPFQPLTNCLPDPGTPRTSLPAWRGTLGLFSANGARTSYQGEVNPFPVPGSLLTFGYSVQPLSGVNNFMLFLNLERSPQTRKALLEVRDAKSPSELLSVHEVINNFVNVIPLRNKSIEAETLLLFTCKKMSGIPLFFTCTEDLSSLTIEHTHPPASSVIHGDRLKAQRFMKDVWFSKVIKS